MVVRSFGDGNPQIRDLLRVLSSICGFVDGNSGLQYAKQLHRIYLDRYMVRANEDNLQGLMYAQGSLAMCQLNLGALGEAHETVEDGLQQCQDLGSRAYRDGVRAQFLHLQGCIRVQHGQLSVAVESFSLALELRLRLYGPGDSRSISTAEWLEYVLAKKRDEQQLTSDAIMGDYTEELDLCEVDEPEELSNDEEAESPSSRDAELWPGEEPELWATEETQSFHARIPFPMVEEYHDFSVDEQVIFE